MKDDVGLLDVTVGGWTLLSVAGRYCYPRYLAPAGDEIGIPCSWEKPVVLAGKAENRTFHIPFIVRRTYIRRLNRFVCV